MDHFASVDKQIEKLQQFNFMETQWNNGFFGTAFY
jgi:hypothetical protein